MNTCVFLVISAPRVVAVVLSFSRDCVDDFDRLIIRYLAIRQHHQIIDPATIDTDGRCVFGATVELEDITSGGKVTYQIVGDDEADIKEGKISISSPIARALIGKYEGDVAEVQAPGGVREYEIVEIRYV
jgi:transcription elongation GreA/GreB family factor